MPTPISFSSTPCQTVSIQRLRLAKRPPIFGDIVSEMSVLVLYPSPGYWPRDQITEFGAVLG